MVNLLQRVLGVTYNAQWEEKKVRLQKESMKDFERVIHILSSCVHEAHIAIADNCFNVFKDKWQQELSKEVMDYNTLIFNRERQRLLDNFAELNCSTEKNSVGLLLT